MTDQEARWSAPSIKAIPRDTWDQFPWNRWTFQNVRQVVATTEVWRGKGSVWEMQDASRDFDELEFECFDGSTTTVNKWLTADYNDGFLVMKSGRIVYERYLNHMTPRTLHLSQSMAKSVTSCVTGVLIEQGLLDPTEQVTHYLPELESTAYAEATVRHVLDMSSGVHYVEDYESLDSHIAGMDIASGWKLPRAGADSPASMWEHILSLHEVVRAHGECFNYRSIETDVLACCMERVSGKRLSDLVSEMIWQPLGCDESASFTVDRCGYASASGGFNATLRDYGRLGQMLCNNGRGNGKQLVPSQWITDTLSEQVLPVDEERKKVLPNGGYRNQFWRRDRSKKIMMARGIYGQLIYIDQSQELVAVVLASWPESLNVDRGVNTLNVIDEISKNL